MKPITPDEAEAVQVRRIPDFVIESFNELIKQNYDSGNAEFSHHDVVALVQTKDRVTPLGQMEHEGWFEAKDLFERSGWRVTTSYSLSGRMTWHFYKKTSKKRWFG
jgi:hypothetical protein